ncbi:hypothetical protein TcWFU_000392 [Taenia crassiceps]|uniref:SURP motif domain-containing protein n=1 Tax=Taenia crassiceps TaxID=6207 RepID=A0ABR4QNA0_9CEST
MDSSRLEVCDDLCVVGCRCSLFNDPEKSLEINSGKLLVPWANNSDLTIDRFDCRGYLQDVSEYDADSIVQGLGSQAAEDADLEEMCNYERYLELQTDIHDLANVQDGNPDKETKGSRGTYATVGFSYNETESEDPQLDSKEANENETSKDHECEPYVCPPDLVLPSGIALPDFERQAAIIEKTAVFIARNNAQMEIVLKTKQSRNPQFNFLNYGDKLNPFYKELVKLIKTGRYIPRQRPFSNTSRPSDPDADVNVDEPYEIKLPKIDISKTAYASLINRFKKSAGDRLSPNHSSVKSMEGDDGRSTPDIRRGTSDVEAMEMRASPDFPPMSEADYEHCYQEYYRYYYSHYYAHFSKGDNVESASESYLVAESARAAATAASAAVNAMRQSQLASKSRSMFPPSDLRGIIDKMAEYVARNGEEFQEVVKRQKQNDVRFAFLQTGHIHHDYYLAKKKEFVTKARPSGRCETSPSAEINRESKHVTSKQESNSPTVARNKSISFRLIKSISSSRLKGMEESISSSAANCEDPSILRTSSCSVLPGMSNYSSASDSEGDNGKDSPPSSPLSNTHDEEPMERTLATVLEVPTVSLPNGSRWGASTNLSPPRKSSASPRSTTHDTPAGGVFLTTANGVPKVMSMTVLTPEEIARDIQSMEEQARLQLERRKRAALFAAKLRQSKLRKVEWDAEEEKRNRASNHLTLSPPQSIMLQTVTAAPPPPPSSVPAAVAHAVVAQLKTQRERALEAAAAADDERKKAHSKSRSPPAAYARRRHRSSESPSDGGNARSWGGGSRGQRRRSRSVSRDRGRSHGRKHRRKRSGQRV